jgi:hypothetical protein
MAKIENSSQGMKVLRENLNVNLDTLLRETKKSAQLVDDVKSAWSDHQYDTFKTNFNNGLGVIQKLLEKMGIYDESLLDLQEKLKVYENIEQVNPCK